MSSHTQNMHPFLFLAAKRMAPLALLRLFYFAVVLMLLVQQNTDAFRMGQSFSPSSLNLEMTAGHWLSVKSVGVRGSESWNGVTSQRSHHLMMTIKTRTRCTALGGFSRRCSLKMGLLDGFKKIVGSADPAEALAMENDKLLKSYMQRVERINAREADLETLSNEQLRARSEALRQRVRGAAAAGATGPAEGGAGASLSQVLDEVLEEAFALVREAAWRVLEMRHFDVQLIGGIALHEGRLAEMATGEGKTLVALLPVYLNALGGGGAFVVTSSDYLARRDGESMGQVLRLLGLSVGVVQAYQKEDARRAAYACDVTYLSNQELGFDFLRDNLAMTAAAVVQVRPYAFCLVDEADSILIDEARTPLIISRQAAAPASKYASAAQIAASMQPGGVHYDVNLKDQKIELTPAGFKFAEQIVGKGLYELADPWAFFIINALKAKELFARDREYIVQLQGGQGQGGQRQGQIAIVDSASGRVLEGRRFTDGLQQAIEAKEGLPVSGETQVVAKVTYVTLFRLFPKLCGMTGTAFTDAAELQETYGLKVLPVPTALPVARRDNPDAVFRTQRGKMKALLRNVLSASERGRPVLLGTTSVAASEEYAQALRDIGVPAVQVLNARPENVERESEIVAQAGRVGAVTVATNMAGRGTDILLGGSAKGSARVLAKHMLLVRLGLAEMPPPAPPAAASLPAKGASSGVGETSGAGGDGDGDDVLAEKSVTTPDAGSDREGNEEGEGEEEEQDEEDEEQDEEEEEDDDDDDDDDEVETDPDVLALPRIVDLAAHLDLWLPRPPSRRAELALQRAVISCSDLFDLRSVPAGTAVGGGGGGGGVMTLSAPTTTGSETTDSEKSLSSSSPPPPPPPSLLPVGRVEVEDIVAQAADAGPAISAEVRLLRGALALLVRDFDPVVKREREKVRKLGGLYVVGTARHESRRTDNQLRGRAGRQGDPGASRFFLSLEDDMFKVFGADKMAGMLENFRVAEDMPIESDLVVQALDKVQAQVEDYFRAQRAQVLRLDQVASQQRATVYSQRRAFLTSSDEGMLTTFTSFCMQTMDEIYSASLAVSAKGVKAAPGGPVDAQKLASKALQFFPNLRLTAEEIERTPLSGESGVQQLLRSRLRAAVADKRALIDTRSSWAFAAFFRYLALVQVDESWCRHLTRLELLKEEMVLQSFTAERDVMETYRESATQLFSTLMDDVRRNTVYSLFIYNPTGPGT